MALKDQFRSVIEWKDPDPEMLFERWTDHGDEIKNASKLIVGPGQGCIFVHEGQVQGVFTEEGVTKLKTANIPFWTNIVNFMQRFESHHKVGIYFFRSAHILNSRWGTTSTIKYDDPKYKFPVGLGAHGNYSMRITEPDSFFREVVAGASTYAIRDLQSVLLSRITEPLSDYMATARFSYAEIDANREEIGQAMLQKLAVIFQTLGFAMLDFRIEGTHFDEETEKRIGRIADMSAEGQAAAAAGIDYVQMQQLEAMKEAAKNEGGMAGMGMSMGTGLAFGQMMGGGDGRPDGPAATRPAAVAPTGPGRAGGR
ncbi:MAG: SPFH domain-containing protein [Planctomycetota bacterium]|nr:SPFH domain-containing protein [Planctomycetota bacterium]